MPPADPQSTEGQGQSILPRRRAARTTRRNVLVECDVLKARNGVPVRQPCARRRPASQTAGSARRIHATCRRAHTCTAPACIPEPGAAAGHAGGRPASGCQRARATQVHPEAARPRGCRCPHRCREGPGRPACRHEHGAQGGHALGAAGWAGCAQPAAGQPRMLAPRALNALSSSQSRTPPVNPRAPLGSGAAARTTVPRRAELLLSGPGGGGGARR